jgi:hypothetical protein
MVQKGEWKEKKQTICIAVVAESAASTHCINHLWVMDELPERKRLADFDYRGRPSMSWLYCADSAVLKQT